MEKKIMTYIDYMNQFWRASSMEYMSASEVALYTFIVNECNLHRWDMPVPCSTVRICEVLHMSKQTLCTARKNLARRGLITFTDGRSRHVPSKYSLLEWTDDLTVELTDGLTAEFTLLKNKDKDNFIKSESTNFSFKEREITNANDSQNRRRGIKEIPATASPYEGTF